MFSPSAALDGESQQAHGPQATPQDASKMTSSRRFGMDISNNVTSKPAKVSSTLKTLDSEAKRPVSASKDVVPSILKGSASSSRKANKQSSTTERRSVGYGHVDEVSTSGTRRNLELEGSFRQASVNPEPPRTSDRTKRSPKVESNTPRPPRTSSTAKKVKVRRSAGKATVSARKRSHPSPRRLDREYSVHFEPGPLGMKLEPVVRGGEIGCRVVRFIDNGTNKESQARASGKIAPSDILVAIDGVEVISKRYADIVSLLKAPAPAEGKNIAFRSVQQSTSDKALSTSNHALSTKKSALQISTSTEEDEGVDATSPLFGLDVPLSNTSNAARGGLRQRTPVADESSSANRSLASPNDASTSPFSPSNVKKLQQSREPLLYRALKHAPPVSDVLSAVAKNVVPASTSTLVSAADVASEKLGEALVGHSSKEFDDAVRLKMELLTELSEAKAALGADEERRKRLESAVADLEREKEDADKAKMDAELALHAARVSEDQLKAIASQKSTELERAYSTVEETVAQANKLTAQNGLLRAQAEQLKVQFAAREKYMMEQLAKDHAHLDERSQSAISLQGEVDRLHQLLKTKDDNLSLVTRDLSDTKTGIDNIKSELKAKELALEDAKAVIDGFQVKMSDLETSRSDLIRSNGEQSARTEADFQARIRTLEENLELNRSEATKANALKEALEKEVQVLTDQLAQSKYNLDEQISEIAQLQKQVMALQQQAEEWRNREEILSNELEQQRDLASQAKASSDDRMTDFETKLNESVSTKEALEQKVQKLTKDLRDERSLASQAKATSDDRISDMEMKLNESVSTKEALEQKVKKLSAELQDERNLASRSNTALKERISDMEMKLNESVSTKEELEQQVSKVTAELRDERNLASQAIAASNDRISDMETKLHESMSTKEVLEQEVNKLSAKLQDERNLASHSNTALNDRVADTETKLYEAKASKEALENKVQKLTAELQNERNLASQANTALKERVADMETELTESLSFKEALKEEANKLTAELQDQRNLASQASTTLEDRIADMETKLDEAVSSRDSLEDEVQRLTTSFAEQRNLGSQAAATAEDRIADIEAKLQEANALKGALEKEVHSLSKELGMSKDILESNRNEIDEQVSQITQLQTEVKVLQQKAEESAKVWQDTEEELKRKLEEERDASSQSGAALKEMGASHAETVRKLETRLDAKKEIVAKLNQKHAESTVQLESEVARLREELTQASNADTSAELENEVKRFTLLKAQLERDLSCARDEAISLQQLVAQKDDSLRTLGSGCDVLQSEKEELTRKLQEESERIIEIQKARNTEVADAKNETKRIRMELEAKVDSLISEVEGVETFMNDEHSKIQSENRELLQSLSSKDAELAELRERIADVERQACERADDRADEICVLKAEIERTKKLADESEKRAFEALAMVDEREKMIAESHKHEEEKEAAAQTAVFELSEVRKQLELVETEKQKLAEDTSLKITDLTRICEDAETRAGKATETLDEQKQMIEELEAETSAARILAATRDEEIAKVEEELTQSKFDLDALRNELEAKTSSVETMTTELKGTVANLNEELLQKMKEIETKTNEAEVLKASLAESKAAGELAVSTVTIERTEKDYLTLRVEALQGELSEHKALINDLERNHAAAQAQVQDIEATTSKNNELRQQVQMLRTTVLALKLANKENEVTKENAEARVLAAEKVSIGLEQQKSDLKTDLHTKSAELRELSDKLQEQDVQLATLKHDLERTKKAYTATTSDLEFLRLVCVEEGTDVSESDTRDELGPVAKDVLASIEAIRKSAQEQEAQVVQSFNELRDAISSPMDGTKSSSTPAGIPSPPLLLSPSLTTGIISKHTDMLEEIKKMKDAINDAMIMSPSQNGTSANNGTPAGILSPLLLSPSLTTGIISKHTDMLEELKKMKDAINNAMIMSPSEDERSGDADEDDDEAKNELLVSMEQRIDGLVQDLSSAKAALDDKENILQDLALSIDDFESERAELMHKLHTIQCYTLRMEETLRREFQWRQGAEAELKDLRDKIKSAALETEEKSEERSKAQARRDEAESDRMDVANEMIRQLETTRKKLYTLKHLLNDDDKEAFGPTPRFSSPRFSPIDTKAAQTQQSQGSNSSSFWDFSDESTLNSY